MANPNLKHRFVVLYFVLWILSIFQMFGALIVLLEYVNKRNMLIVSLANVQSAAFVPQNEGKTNIAAETKTSRNLVQARTE